VEILLVSEVILTLLDDEESDRVEELLPEL
jgi:hypothetical protein